MKKPFFIHFVVPRITIAQGRVLLLPDAPAPEPRYCGIDPENVLAGSAIVSAYYLEKRSAGGLVTIDEKGIEAMRKLTVRGNRSRITKGLDRWMKGISDRIALESGRVFGYRGKILDVPWLLLQPIQNEAGSLWGSLTRAKLILRLQRRTLMSGIRGIREFYSPQNFDAPLDVVKHCQSAIRFAVNCYSMSNGRQKPNYESASDVMAKLRTR